MNVTLQRLASPDTHTPGEMTLDGKHLCFTLELPWRDNEALVSCIPAGEYKCVQHFGPRYSNVWELLGVPGRSSILIHHGNTTDDTNGCILIGDSIGVVEDFPAVLNSRKTLMHLRGIFPKNFTLTIKEPT